ncbi:hypothetical protein Vadar_005365 [Vaccinium darrowii]|uniref:Uncharacterized protein n=1 Tax=Vaccinium darrowii TaxID=229202 RepID=A0ACB7XNE4_9ERIC|nr:hypothetical protein Vadar_005365 [Vaccinium darrowii]
MAEISVSAALFSVEQVLFSLGQLPVNDQKAVQKDVEHLDVCLRTLGANLADMDGNEGSEQLRERVKQIRDVAFNIEDVLAEYMYNVSHRFHRHRISDKYDELAYAFKFWNPLSSVHELVSKIAGVKTEINSIVELDQLRFPNGSTRTSGSTSRQQVAPYIPGYEEIVGFKEHVEALICQLTSQESRIITISVVGPGGSGKTTIVKNVYESKRIKRRFDCRAWVQVSQSLDIEELFGSMLKQFCESRKKPIPGTNTHDKLRRYLQGKRYVLVLDDIWRKEHWESIHKVFPRGSKGNRIIVTTQNSNVASFCAELPDFIHNLTALPQPAAWDLFCKKAFQPTNGQCPRELEDLSQKIVKRCEGLPLAIVAVGSLLSKKNKLPLEWKKVHDSLGFEIGSHSDLSTISKILLPRYTDLPTHLKNCFLYFCVFPEDYPIDCMTLVRLWIAEGFVSRNGGETAEEVAERYLNELIERNLVHATRLDFDGQARYCRVLYLVRGFIIRKSEEVNFFSQIRERDACPNKKIRRVSIDNGCSILSQSMDLTSVRSAFLFKRGNVSASAIEDILRASKFVRVLDLRDAPLDKFPEAILLLNLLRYLCLRNTKIKEIPNYIKKLSYLETLDLKHTRVTTLPKGIFQLCNLRHLLIYWYRLMKYATWDFVVGVKIASGISGLTNLQKLSLIKSDKHHEIVKELGALTQLRKLGLVDLRRDGGKCLCASVEKMKHLSTLDVSSTNMDEFLDLDYMQSPPPHLQRLYLKGRLQQFPGWISKLDNLFRIHLKWSRLQNSPLHALQELPNLLELEMVDAFTGDELVFEAGGFKKLKILHIKQFEQLNRVEVEQGAMPMLQKLSLWKCMKLEMLPLGIDNLTQIEELLLCDMPVEFTNRLQQNHEDHEMVRHIRCIKYFVLQADGCWPLENPS